MHPVGLILTSKENMKLKYPFVIIENEVICYADFGCGLFWNSPE